MKGGREGGRDWGEVERKMRMWKGRALGGREGEMDKEGRMERGKREREQENISDPW